VAISVQAAPCRRSSSSPVSKPFMAKRRGQAQDSTRIPGARGSSRSGARRSGLGPEHGVMCTQTLVIRGDRIVDVGAAVPIPAGARVIDLSNAHGSAG